MGERSVVQYGVRFATDDQMPAGHDIVMIRSAEETIVFYRDSKVDRDVVTKAWGAFHAVAPDLLLQAG